MRRLLEQVQRCRRLELVNCESRAHAILDSSHRGGIGALK